MNKVTKKVKFAFLKIKFLRVAHVTSIFIPIVLLHFPLDHLIKNTCSFM